MIGQGRPISWNPMSGARIAVRRFRFLARSVLLFMVACSAWGQSCLAEEISVRLRLAWGSGDSAKHRWVGRISCPEATLSDLQPLGIEADAPAAILLIDNQIVVEPWEKRGFDGCDVTVVGEAEASIRFELRSEQASSPTVIEVPLGKLATEHIPPQPLDSLGSFVVGYRCPGDRFRVLVNRENLIFQPGEIWPLRLQTDFAAELSTSPIVVEVLLREVGKDSVLWQSTQVIKADSPAPDLVALEVACPLVEGAYRLSLSARTEQSFATRFVPGQGIKPFATREIDLVVIDPSAKLPPLVDHWTTLLSIDPANPSWWQRLPTWAQVSRLTGKPPGSIGNVRLLSREGDANGFVALPPSANEAAPYWQSFALPVLEVGVPHLVEISYPRGERQHLGVSIIEPDAAGRVMSSVVDSGFYVEEVIESTSDQIDTHRVVFWPRTSSPQLLIVNRHAKQPGVFGRITLSRHDDQAGRLAANGEVDPASRLIAGYIAKPVFAQNFGAAEVLDPASGMSVQSWSTFLDGARRLTQHLKLAGYNSALVSVAADGSAIYPSETLCPSPRYDTGTLAASGQDPIRKDVLEMLLRICDREGVRLVPTLQLAAPLPRLESLRTANETSGIAWINANGQQLIEANRGTVNFAANYNLLDERVQKEVIAMVREVAQRYGKHSALAGIALQVDSTGFGVLPGLEWGLDDRTIATFTEDTGIEVPASGENRFRQRSAALSIDHKAEWQAWRIKKVTQFYAQLAEQLQAERSELKLILTTENLFADPALEQAVRRNVSSSNRLQEVLAERGIDLKQLAAIPGVEVTITCRLRPHENLQTYVAELVLNEATQRRDFLSAEHNAANMVFHSLSQSRLPSFDELSPFGADRTHLVLAHQTMPAGSANQQFMISAIGGNPIGSIIQGGEYLTTTLNSEHRDYLRTLEQMPLETLDSRSVKKQPLVMQIARSAGETYVICFNESPWTVAARFEVESSSAVTWHKLGSAEYAADQENPATGQLAGGKTQWSLQLAPHGLQVWKFDTPQLRVGEPQVAEQAFVREYLQRRIEEINTRTGNLDIVRDYPQLQNPGFEMEDGGARIFGWQPRKGINGAVEVETAVVHGGERALRLRSDDNVGVAVQSHLFALPATGMLVVAAQVRAEAMTDNSRLTIAVETEEGGQIYRRVRTLTQETIRGDQWTPVEIDVHDLPVGDAEQIRVQFHVTGNTNLVLDDIKLCDLRFDDQRRSEFVKRAFAAKAALQENEVIDCLRLVDGYWSRYLVEYVPPLVREPALAKQPASAEKDSGDAKTKAGGRWRNLVPRFWR